MDIGTIYTQWATNRYFDEETRKELETIADNNSEIRDRFYKELNFGTAGIRGIIGAGTNRMNKYVVRRLSTAIAAHILSKGTKAKKDGIVIGYDSRNFSEEFAKEAAAVFAGNGIKVYLHTEIIPVPVLSFSVRHLRCAAGVMITASHNPKEYNGYKVYGPDGAQLSLTDSAQISRIMLSITDYTKVPSFSFDFFKTGNNIKYVDSNIKSIYLKEVKKLIADKEGFKKNAGKITVVYTPLHGAGAKWIPEILKECGVTNLHTVKEQMQPDGNFPTVNLPNPEDPAAFTMALDLAKNIQADIVLASDPDSDRTGVYARTPNGDYAMLNGNQIGVLLLERIIESHNMRKMMPVNPFVVSTVVSTRLTKQICETNNIEYIDVLTGFKFIGEKIMELDERGDKNFLFGFEESYGYLPGTYARDKDAVAGCLFMAEAAAHYAASGKTLFEALDDIYKKYSYHNELQVSINLKGESGLRMIQKIMDVVRNAAGRFTANVPAVYTDIQTSEITKYNADGSIASKEKSTLPSSNVLTFDYGDRWFCLRPSGTEPKIKIYFGGIADNLDTAHDKAIKLKEEVVGKIMPIIKK
ncbi:MAG: phospho-sugar mutase [Clostridiales bacterium]|nr:phospho-sugar mutase [Clostridiales bacterium]